MATERRCTAVTKAGKACRARPLRDHAVCLAHSDEATRGGAAFGGPQPRSGRPLKAKTSEIERRLMEEYALAWMRPYWLALGFEVGIDNDGELYLLELPEGGAKLYGESKDGDINMTNHDDLGAQIAAAEKLRDRVYGRPRQTTEISGPGGGKIDVDVSSEEVKDAREAFLASFPDGKVPLAIGGALVPTPSRN